jgi:hypothetical protein
MMVESDREDFPQLEISELFGESSAAGVTPLDCNATEECHGPFHGTFGLFTEELEPRMVTCERTSGEGLAQLHASIFNQIGGVLFSYRR